MEQNQLQVQAKTELPHLKSGEEKFEVALQSAKVKEAPLENLKQVLRLSMLKLGIRANNLPDEEEKQILINYIVEYYGNHTCEEIQLAFDLAISGKLNIDVKAYENFSCLYFSQIMLAYREWTRYPMQKVRAKQERLMLPYENRDSLTEEEMIEWHDEVMSKECKDFNFLSPLLYDWMRSTQKIYITPEGKKEYFNKAIVIHRNIALERTGRSNLLRNEYQNFIDQENEGEFNEATKKSIESTAKKLALYDYFKKKTDENS